MTTGTRSGSAPSLGRAAVRYLPVGLALLVVQLDFFSLNLAMPHIAEDLDVQVTDLQWLMSGYMLSLGALFIPASKLGDAIGRKRVVVIGLVVFGVMSLACGLASDAAVLIVFRVLQGIGAGMIMPNAYALVGATTPESIRARTMGILLAVAGIGTAFGPVVGGVFAASVGWRWVFLINVPVAVVAIVASRWLPEYYVGERRAGLGAVDWAGAVLVTAGVGLVSVGIDDVSTLGVTAALTWGPILLGLGCLALFGRHIVRAAAPLVRPALFGNGRFIAVALAGTVLNTAVGVVMFTGTLQLQSVDDYAPTTAGLLFVGCSVGVALAGPAAGWLTDAFGPKPVLSACLAAGAVAVGGLAVSASLLWLYVLVLAVAGFTGGMGWTVAQIGVQQILPAETSGEGSGLMSMFMVVGGAVGIVVSGVVIESLAGPTPTEGAISAVLVGLAVLQLLFLPVVLLAALGPRAARP